jgi:hypothetical protein
MDGLIDILDEKNYVAPTRQLLAAAETLIGGRFSAPGTPRFPG